MIDSMPPGTPDLGPGAFDAEPVFDAPPEKRRRRRWVLLAVAGFTLLVITGFAVFALGVVGASAAGGCGGP